MKKAAKRKVQRTNDEMTTDQLAKKVAQDVQQMKTTCPETLTRQVKVIGKHKRVFRYQSGGRTDNFRFAVTRAE